MSITIKKEHEASTIKQPIFMSRRLIAEKKDGEVGRVPVYKTRLIHPY